MISRIVNLSNYKHSTFLFGPRQTGKTWLLKNTLSTDLYINLLKEEEFLRYSKNFSLLEKEVRALSSAKPLVVIDEIQRLPQLLNEVHALMEEIPDIRFVLTGSSARKLRKRGVNLLGGRALTLHLHPFTHLELKEKFSLEEALHFGTLPKIVTEKNEKSKIHLLKSYVTTYLKEEIQQESLTRNIPAFSRFLELAAFENGHILNYANLSREIGIEGKTIKEYFQILEDTLIGSLLPAYSKSHRVRMVRHPKFYFFDPGVVRALRSQLTVPLIEKTAPFGEAFEHWVILETKRLIDYREMEATCSYFATSDGGEVDLILEKPQGIWAIEIKSSKSPQSADIRSLRSFVKDHKVDRAFCVCRTPRMYEAEGIEFIPWREFFKLI